MVAKAEVGLWTLSLWELSKRHQIKGCFSVSWNFINVLMISIIGTLELCDPSIKRPFIY